MTKFHSMLLASAAAVVAGLGMTVSAQAADQILSGSIATALVARSAPIRG